MPARPWSWTRGMTTAGIRWAWHTAGPAIGSVAVAVDRNIDLHVVDQLRSLVVRERSNVVESIKCLDDAGADVAAVVAAEGHAVHLEARTIVALKEFRHEISRGVAVEIRREIGDAQFGVRPDSPAP